MSPKHPKAASIAVVFFAAWHLLHYSALAEFLWHETPPWLQTLALKAVASFHLSSAMFAIGLMVGIVIGVKVARVGRWLLTWLLSVLPSETVKQALEKSEHPGEDQATK